MTEGKDIDKAGIDTLHVITDRIRYRICKLVQERPLHINMIAKGIQEERRLASYHLNILEEYGVLTSKYEISMADKSKGKAIRSYWLTPLGKQALTQLEKAL
jgi:predicted transcriptional regulator